MTPHAARILANRIAVGFERRPHGTADEWATALEPLDEGTAGTVYARLRTNGNPPTITEFVTAVTANTPTAPPAEHCTRCDDTGWAEAYVWEGDGTARPTGAKPCHCEHGERIAARLEQLDPTPPRHARPRYLTDLEREQGLARLAEIRAQFEQQRSRAS